ncbi:MAG: site-specific DNA-methyltransferase, partial [Synergistaceae bacterium]|nr:site-specific DNA-methyltransferase [Synergistaceae bacterium]
FDDEGSRNFSLRNYRENSKSNPRFHSDWLSMIYPRLKLARNLLADDGVIFISIDDNEAANLRKICDEIFGESNFIAQLVWEKKKKGSFLSKAVTNIKEYVLVFCVNYDKFEGLIGEIDSDIETYPCINAVNKRELRTIPAGIESRYKDADFFVAKGSEISDTTMSLVLHSDLVIKNGVLAEPLTIEGNWRYSQVAMTEYAMKKELYITRDLYIRRIVSDVRSKTMKDLLPRVGDNPEISYKDKIDLNNLNSSGWGSNEDADEELRLMFGVQKLIDYPKPLRLIMKLLASYRNTKDSIILDFFAGSSTTAHAVMQLNHEDGGTRKFIMIHLPEQCSESSEAFKAGYHNICEIGRERIKRAGESLSGDTGFRVLKVDSSNYRNVYFTPEELKQDMLDDLIENIKPDRTGLDLLFGTLAELGLPLTQEFACERVNGFTVYYYGDDVKKIIACFDRNINAELVKSIAGQKPMVALFRDSCFEDSNAMINLEQIFRHYAPESELRIL